MSEIPKIIECDLKRVADFGTLLWFETDAGRRCEFYIEHRDYDEQSRGQKALAILSTSCSGTITDTSELVGAELHDLDFDRILQAIDGGKRRRIAARQPVEPPPPKQTPKPGGKYVYVISCVDSDPTLCKIGIAKSAESRLRSLSTASPHALRLEMARYCDSARAIESAAHEYFSKNRKNGEWFEMAAAEAIAFVNQAIEGAARA